MKQMMEMLQATNSNSNSNRSSRRNPNLTKYCWTHGLCSHSSNECRTKADGHKNNATLQNRLGGSNKNITWNGGPVRSYRVIQSKINNTYYPTTPSPVAHTKSTSTTVTLKADSGASKHFLKQIDAHILANRHHGVGTSVLLPNKEELHTTSAGTLPLSSVLPQQATLAHVLSGMSNSSLLSIGQLCDADCWALFNKRYLPSEI